MQYPQKKNQKQPNNWTDITTKILIWELINPKKWSNPTAFISLLPIHVSCTDPQSKMWRQLTSIYLLRLKIEHHIYRLETLEFSSQIHFVFN